MNNGLAKSRIYIGRGEVYLIEGLELDIEFDYLSLEDRTKAILELEDYIQSHDIQPVKIEDGYAEVEEDKLFYVVDAGVIGYATGFEVGESQSKNQ
ncbi:hypothetical protein [Oceanobacillus rekensis]|uniref:hypothetical protein n=1 Tax=Oceanobacillus rekensis TaxID=937927 RepID=UPI000B446B8D|nr:hypothetical protein [Oceanobacillus rekensis]